MFRLFTWARTATAAAPAYDGYASNAVDEEGRPYTEINCTAKIPIG